MQVKESGQFEQAPAGSHVARCYGLIDMGSQPHSFQGESWTQRDVRIMFELPSCKMTGIYKPDAKGKPFMVSSTQKQSLHVKARLRALLKGWRGRDFSKDELAGFDLKNILGKPCRVNLVASPDGQYTNIDSISPVSKEDMKKYPKCINEPVYVSLDPAEFDPEAFKELSEKVQEKIKKTPEYAALTKGDEQESPTDEVPMGEGEVAHEEGPGF